MLLCLGYNFNRSVHVHTQKMILPDLSTFSIVILTSFLIKNISLSTVVIHITVLMGFFPRFQRNVFPGTFVSEITCPLIPHKEIFILNVISHKLLNGKIKCSLVYS